MEKYFVFLQEIKIDMDKKIKNEIELGIKNKISIEINFNYKGDGGKFHKIISKIKPEFFVYYSR